MDGARVSERVRGGVGVGGRLESPGVIVGGEETWGEEEERGEEEETWGEEGDVEIVR
jgi:hypothetical protein